jgi:hypothetical protein
VYDHAPGGLGVFIEDLLTDCAGVTGVSMSWPASDSFSDSEDVDGGAGRSGRPLGGVGVWNCIAVIENDDLRGGVANAKEGC